MLYGCIGLVVLGLLAAVGSYFGAKQMLKVAAGEIYESVGEEMRDMDLSDQERQDADKILVELRDGMRSGDIGLGKMPEIIEAMQDGDIISYGLLLSIRQDFAEDTTLSDDERADGKRQLGRIGDGIAKNRFGTSEMEDILGTIVTRTSDGQLEVNEDPTSDELRETAKRAKEAADQANLSEDPPPINFVGELQAILDRVKE